jgi:subtilisin family serine protease
MSARTRLGRTAWKKPIIAVLAAALVLGSLAAVLLTRRAPPPEATPSQEPLSGNPATDDVPDAPPPLGVVRPGTAGGTPAAPTVRVLADQLLVKFEEGTPPGVVNRLLAKAGVTPRSRIDRTGTRVIGMPPARRAAALAVLASSPAVEYAESDVVLEQLGTVPNDPRWSDQWGPRKVSAPGAWDAARGSSSVVIAVLDTGVDFGHGDLRGAAAAGYDFVNGDSNPADDQGHGTAAAGVLAARTNNAVGLAGMCWACSLASVKVLDANGSGSTSTVARGIVWAADHGARVISLSLGGPSGTQTLANAVEYAAGKGVVIVAAAGNSGTSTPFYPAAYPAVLSVGGTDPSDRRYNWSNYGSWVKVAAPGCNVSPLRGGGYGTFCGTSSATPVVAGLAGLALSAKPGATKAEIERAIKSAAIPIGGAVKHGRVDAAQTLVTLGAGGGAVSPATTAATAEGVISRSHPRRVYRRVVGAGALAARLTFTGAPKLTLSIVNSNGVTIRRVSGASPLRRSVTVRAGTFRFVVKGKDVRRAPFTLRITYQA